MRTCPNCGANVADTDDFCGNCGTYLGWLRPAPEPTADARAGQTTETVNTPGAEPEGGGVSGVAGEPAGAGEQPGAVAPARPVTRRPRPGPARTEITSNGPPCRVCGTANPQGARFCRRCAAPLTEAAPVAPSRRRFRWPRLRLRGGGGSPWRRRMLLVLVLAALVVAGVLLYPFASGVVEDARDKLSTPERIGPVRTVASAEVPGHPARAVVDGATNRYWGAPSVGAWAEFEFADPFRLLGVVIHTGAATDGEVFDQQGRVSTLDIVATTASGATTTIPVTLADQPGPQRTDTAVSDVVSIRVVIRSAAGLTRGRHIALGELEFFRRP